MNPMISGAGSQGIMGVKTWLCSTNGDIPPDLLVPRKQEYVNGQSDKKQANYPQNETQLWFH